MNSNFLVTVLTLAAIAINLVVAARALLLVKRLEDGECWVCQSVGISSVKIILYGIVTICLMLVVLKFWSVFDVFLKYWELMPDTYHIRAYAYLSENYGVGMLGYAIVSMITKMTQCANAKDVTTLT